ncbi:MAG: hypothetical protein IT307_19705, partial [Chloroflexi bacterium]|nr:hypothetical protein [Chloroflexota bacterium]
MGTTAGNRGSLIRIAATAVIAAAVIPIASQVRLTTAQEGYSAQEISRIARNDNAQVKPRISGSNVVWQDYRNIPA